MSAPYNLKGTINADTLKVVDGIGFIDGGDGYDTVEFDAEPGVYRFKKDQHQQLQRLQSVEW